MRPLLALTCVLMVLAFGSSVRAQDYPAHGDVYVNDFANILTDAETARIRQDLIGLFDQTGIEAVVVTMGTMRSYGHSGQIEAFATGLFNHWGVGNAKLDTGVMLLVARDDRQMRIELGTGFDPSMDRQMQSLIDTRLLPEFRKGRFGPGIVAGVDGLMQVLGADATTSQPAGLLGQVKRGVENLSTAVLAVLAAIVAALSALALRLYQMWQRSRPRFCPVDGHRMDLLAEAVDDSHLQAGQTTEERLNSVDYDVWDCPKCQHVTVETYRRWFSRYGACRACGYKTLEGTTTVLQEATTSSTGQKRIDFNCHNCSESYSELKSIPMKSESGSSRTSFGGGSSSGGGASGRW